VIYHNEQYALSPGDNGAHNVQSTTHQTINFRPCTALITKAQTLISNYKRIARRAVDRT
jgi:hypothetical protein